jgi:uncharacterized protein YfaS (alpha-2-macroglobulin family)
MVLPSGINIVGARLVDDGGREISSVNRLPVSASGMVIPYHDQQVIEEADPDNVTITYKLNGVTVAVKTIAVAGTQTTITIAVS